MGLLQARYESVMGADHCSAGEEQEWRQLPGTGMLRLHDSGHLMLCRLPYEHVLGGAQEGTYDPASVELALRVFEGAPVEIGSLPGPDPPPGGAEWSWVGLAIRLAGTDFAVVVAPRPKARGGARV